SLVWRQTPREITQIPISVVIEELKRHNGWTPEKITRQLLEEKELIKEAGIIYHIWRDSLH
ncbi:MAG: hypothetical protein GY765_09535, partial [bacterium]|nr:hypothetical protein [bacterium]